MIRLDLKREPYWLDLGHGVSIMVKPCTSALMLAARSAAARALEPETEAPISPEEALGQRASGFMKALARLAITGWKGVGGADDQPAEVTNEGIDALMDLWPIADAFERKYLGPALLLADEKNV